LLVVRFKIRGSLRFLSHAETLRVFQRACVRTGIRVRYSEGFNPRPKLSLPLPRPVGVESDEELLCLRVDRDPSPEIGEVDASEIQAELAAQLPEGCELLSVSSAKAGTSFQPGSATYVLPVRQEYLNERLQATAERLLASSSLHVRRRMDAKGSRVKNVDVRGFLTSIKLDHRGIMVECRISPAGSIRVDEILGLLELDEAKLSGPIRRTNVQWRNN
jgi:radical SAM-linked protein